MRKQQITRRPRAEVRVAKGHDDGRLGPVEIAFVVASVIAIAAALVLPARQAGTAPLPGGSAPGAVRVASR